MENNGKKSFTGNYRHINIRYLFVMDRVEIINTPIIYCSIEHMLECLFTKSLQGDLFHK